MTQSRHKHRKSRPLVRRIAPVAAPAALVAGVAGGTIAWSTDGTTQHPEDNGSLTALERPQGQSVSRGAERPTASATDPAPDDDAAGPSVSPTTTPSPEATEEADAADETPDPTAEPEPTAEPSPEPTAVGTLFATAGLNVRSGPGTDHDVVTVLERGSEVDVTGESDGRFSQVLIDGDALWASGEYLSEEEPTEDEDAGDGSGGGISQAECPHGSSVESGLTADAIRVHRAVCHRFPGVDSYGGVRPGDGGAHGSGRAIDIMITGSTGDSIAAWLRENHDALGITELIWEQRIWTVQRSSDGWRWMEDRGGPTANHYDHVHVTVSGDSGTV